MSLDALVEQIDFEGELDWFKKTPEPVEDDQSAWFSTWLQNNAALYYSYVQGKSGVTYKSSRGIKVWMDLEGSFDQKILDNLTISVRKYEANDAMAAAGGYFSKKIREITEKALGGESKSLEEGTAYSECCEFTEPEAGSVNSAPIIELDSTAMFARPPPI